jgi:hypothetical protein
MLSMPMIVPACEWLSLSRRANGLYIEEILLQSGSGFDFCKLWLFPVLGDQRFHFNPYLVLTAHSGSMFLASSFVGPVAVLLAIFGFCDRQWRGRWLVLAGLVVFSLLVAGNNTPIAPALFSSMPVFQMVRFPIKLMYFVVLAISLAAARGACTIDRTGGERTDAGTESPADRAALSKGAIAAALLLSMSGLILAIISMFDPSYVRQFLNFGSQFPLYHIRQAVKELAFCQAWMSAGMMVFCLALLISTPINRRKVLAGGVAITAALSIVNGTMVGRHFAGTGLYTTPSAIANTIARLATAGSSRGSDGHPATDGAPSKNGGTCSERATVLYHSRYFLEPPWLLSKDAELAEALAGLYDRQMLVPNNNMDFHVPSSWGYEAAVTGDYYNAFMMALAQSTQSRLLFYEGDVKERTDEPMALLMRNSASPFVLSQCVQMQNGSLVAVPELDKRFFQPLLTDLKANCRIYKTIGARQRVWISHKFLLANNDLSTGDGASPTSALTKEQQSDRISWLKDEPEEIVLKTGSDVDGYLILSDTFYPGWLAYIDGNKTPIFRADAFFRAVGLPKGTHNVVFAYKPASWYIGLAIASIAWLLLTGLGLKALQQKGYSNEKKSP